MTINPDFLYYLVDKYAKSAAKSVRVQYGNIDVKTLLSLCTSSPIAGGGKAYCTATDATGSAYYFDRAYLLRSSYTIDGVTSDEIGYIATTRTWKDGAQALDFRITVTITTG